MRKKLTLYLSTIAALVLLIFGLAYWNEIHVARIPILMYHHLAESGDPGSTISADFFEAQIKALKDAGYTAVSFDDLCDFVNNGAVLPDLPVVITFDDGYKSVYEEAFPILQKHNIKATVFIIGIFHGENFYKGAANRPITPHLGDAEVKEMADSGLVSIQSHSYDMHQLVPYESASPRIGVQRRDDESRVEYKAAFNEDFTMASEQIEQIVGVKPFVYSYPYGRFTRLSESLLKKMGVMVTVTTVAKTNMITRNSPNSLFKLGRFNVPGDMTPKELLTMIAR